MNVVCVTELASLAQVAQLSVSYLSTSESFDALGPFAIRIQPWEVDGAALSIERLAKEITLDDPAATALIGSDVPLAAAFELASFLEAEHPEVTSMLVAEPSADLWRDAIRAGFSDIVDSTKPMVDLPLALDRTLGVRARRAATVPTGTAGRVIVVLAPKGGCGKTTVASNLAAVMADARPGEVVAIDLDVQFGDLGVALGLVPEHTISELVQAPTLDSTTLKLYLTNHKSGAYVLCGSSQPEDADAVTDRHVSQIVKLMARDFPIVIVDTPAGLDERTLAVIEVATDLVFVSSLDVSSIRTLRKEIDTLDRLSVVTATRHFVLNRSDSKVGLDASDVEAAVGMPVNFSVPSSRSVPSSMNLGDAVALSAPESAVGRELRRLAHALDSRVDDPDATKSRRILRKRAS